MLPSLFERSLEFNRYYKYNRTSKFLIILKLNLISQKQNFSNRIVIKLNCSDADLKFLTNIEEEDKIFPDIRIDDWQK